MSTAALLLLTAAAVGFLLLLVVVLRLHAFVALLVTSLLVALVGGIPLNEIAALIQSNMGSTLGYIAVVIGLGAMFGEMLQRSGGANAIAEWMVRTCGDHRAPWALALTGLIVSVPVFFDVALVVLLPLTANLARKSGRSLLAYAVPLLAGMAIAHAFIPPTPGPVAVAGLLGADLGWVIVLGFVAGLPALIVGGIWFGKVAAGRLHVEVPELLRTDDGAEVEDRPSRPQPSFAVAAGLVGLPLVLILLSTGSAVLLPEESLWRQILGLLGHPFSALLVATLLAFYLLGIRLGFSPTEVRDMASKGLEPVGLIILVTGAGGVFGKVLFATGVGEALAEWMSTSGLSTVVMGFLIAAAVRVAQGSATVSMVTAAGLMAPLLAASGVTPPQAAAVVIGIASGATVLSHVNDSGFWLVSRYLGMEERETLRVWTVMTTLVGGTGFLMVLLLSEFL